jgi:hypothetical protein
MVWSFAAVSMVRLIKRWPSKPECEIHCHVDLDHALSNRRSNFTVYVYRFAAIPFLI